MKQEVELTVLTELSFVELKELLINNSFHIDEQLIIDDSYYSKDNSLDFRKISCDCVLVRHIYDDVKTIKKCITKKKKEYNQQNEIVYQSKDEKEIDDITLSKEKLTKEGYHHIVDIQAKCFAFSNNEDELFVQVVNDRVYIEIEQEMHRLNKKYKDIDEIKNVFVKYHIPIRNNNYFASKFLDLCYQKYNII